MRKQATHVITKSRYFRTVQHRYTSESCEHYHTVVALGFTLSICIPFSDIAGALSARALATSSCAPLFSVVSVPSV